MFFARRPSTPDIERFLLDSQPLPLSYDPRTAGARKGEYDVDDSTTTIGHGRADLARAHDALAAWDHFALGWTEIFPRSASLAPGTVVAVLVHHLGFWSLNGCRVVRSVGAVDGDRFGFAYGTLTDHAESGEETFEVVLEANGAVTYRIRAISRPRAPVARIGYPIVRRLQARFRRDSALAMTRAVAARRQTA